MKTKSAKSYITYVIQKHPHQFNNITQTELIQIVYDILSVYDYSKHYARMIVAKTTVNNPKRVLLGELGDLFYTSNEKYFLYTDENVTIYRYDTEQSSKNRVKSKIQRNIDYNDYVTKYKKLQSNLPLRKSNKKILVIGGCTKTKNDIGKPQKSINLYNGQETTLYRNFLHSMNFNNYEQFSQYIDFYIISAGYGLISSEDYIEDYNMTFNTIKKVDARKFGREVGIRNRFDELLKLNKYDYVYICLGDKYINTLDLKLPFDTLSNIFFILPFKVLDANINKPKGKNVNLVFTNLSQLQTHNIQQTSLKGKIITSYLREIIETDNFELLDNPSTLQNWADNKILT